MSTKRLCYACDLKDDAALIEEYKKYHQEVWPEIKASISESGIIDMEIYILSSRLFMIMEVDETYTPQRKQMMDAANPKVQEWEELMWKFQQAPPGAKDGEKWLPMEQIFKL
ncbi:L-rhamnose mutarotase [Flavobacterium sp. HJJ]|uniref:L-rhamnose mutarotase n=1 Tax=Flavobacterium sp. HJJ TaxID=2783792 RepID=UPI00188D62AE|nr:L-rhamnose mutarotase [Flavobacterium sp. HJJ]MBF4470526.1 L-rhamnose mutarotase [Flavobacterium sp. HJJ]